MSVQRKPLFLLADSQTLFRNVDNTLLSALQESLHVRERNITRAAYIGASNSDAREYFELFVDAMDGINLHETRMIHASFGSEDRSFLESADLLLLAGGDVGSGWKVIRSTGMDAVITARYYSGAVVAGVSAGAMQLGMGWQGMHDGRMSDGLKLVPYYIDVHGERDDWRRLRSLVEVREDHAKGLGIPSGGAMVFHADLSMEAMRYPVAEFDKSPEESGGVKGNLLLPAPPTNNAINFPGYRG